MSTGRTAEGWTRGFADVDGVRLHYVEAGDGPLILLLHGFPDFWYSWSKQLDPLARAGFRCVAPDLRGYNRSDKPSGVAAYQVDRVAGDIAALIRNLGGSRAVVAGHDWGGLIAWELAASRPELLRRLVVLNAPHPAAFTRELVRSTQLLRSWYVLAVQIPWLPEAALRARGFALLKRLLRRAGRGSAFSEEELERYRRAFARPGALTAALDYYRAALRRAPRTLLRRGRRIELPTLLIWGERDRALVPRLTHGLERWVPRIRVERLNAGHWVHRETPVQVNALLIEWLAESA